MLKHRTKQQKRIAKLLVAILGWYIPNQGIGQTDTVIDDYQVRPNECLPNAKNLWYAKSKHDLC